MISLFLVLLLLILLFLFLLFNVEIENNNVKIDVASENIDNGKSILRAPFKQDKKDVKNPKVMKANSQKPK